MVSGTKRLSISSLDLRQATEQGVISEEQGDALWRFLAGGGKNTPSSLLDLPHLLWYTGALIVIGAMGLFSTLAFARWGGFALTMTAAVYAVLFTAFGRHLWQRQLTTPGGLCLTIAVTMTPLFVFGIQDVLGWWSHSDPGDYRDFFRWIRASWLPMEVTTIAAGLIVLTFYRFPFLIAPIAVALWFLSMDLVPWIFGEAWSGWDQRRIVSLWFGFGMIATAWWVDVKARTDLAFWLHLFGLIAFWGALSATQSGNEFAKAIYCLINIVLLIGAVFLQRRAYAVFGAIGISLYLGHLAGHVFQDSILYPFALSFVGLLILGAGLFYHRHQGAIGIAVHTFLPKGLQHLRPAHAQDVTRGDPDAV